MKKLWIWLSSVTHPAIWRCGVSCRRCGCECEGCASLKEMVHLQWETTASPGGNAASPAGDAVSPAGDLLASPNFGICDTTLWYWQDFCSSILMFSDFIFRWQVSSKTLGASMTYYWQVSKQFRYLSHRDNLQLNEYAVKKSH